MLRIVTHIERLLLVHDCVIVPKFGGFVLQAVPAMQHKEEHTFRPLRKEIGFNMTLQHNDGLLPESYMQMHEVSYRQAQLMLEEDVEDIKNILQQYGKLSLGVLGSFSIGEEGQMIFHPGETDLFSVGSYGFYQSDLVTVNLIFIIIVPPPSCVHFQILKICILGKAL